MGGRIINIDVCLIGERPKISPYREAITQKIAGILKIRPNRINVKATTTEKMGFTGRGEGLASQAIATIELPMTD
jgi:2-C-methyl-D-erythritol 4-phosphate cytidylyltransferase/2-C-methyl-D-erythritol 2,4-cyclodiphosphate synthase